ncbi:MAG: hypothetical protein U9Q92_01900 [archaeon]|nr:hypothetical protein [archaeon]
MPSDSLLEIDGVTYAPLSEIPQYVQSEGESIPLENILYFDKGIDLAICHAKGSFNKEKGFVEWGSGDIPIGYSKDVVVPLKVDDGKTILFVGEELYQSIKNQK